MITTATVAAKSTAITIIIVIIAITVATIVIVIVITIVVAIAIVTAVVIIIGAAINCFFVALWPVAAERVPDSYTCAYLWGSATLQMKFSARIWLLPDQQFCNIVPTDSRVYWKA